MGRGAALKSEEIRVDPPGRAEILLRTGEDGYMRLARGVNACGIANFVSYPNV